MRFALATLVPLALATTGYAKFWIKSIPVVGESFYNHFEFQTIGAPYSGRADFVDYDTAIANNLTQATENTFIIRADSVNKVVDGQRGRKSVRLSSNFTVRRHLAIFDLNHVPQDCATWPSITEEGQGQVTILDGGAPGDVNFMGFRTPSSCTIQDNSNVTNTQCGTFGNITETGGLGCPATGLGSAQSVNSVGGGWYVVERTDESVKIWFWAKNGTPPPEVQNAANTIETDTWGTPVAEFDPVVCDISSLGLTNLTITLNFCGPLGSAKCDTVNSCSDYVDNFPEKFTEAYWSFNGVYIYLTD